MPTLSETETARKIANLNDLHRRSGRFIVTQGVAALAPDQQLALARLVMEFSDFTEDNDPYGDHDFGAVDLDGVKYFWKIVAYDLAMEMGSEDATDPSLTRRALTVMRADEW